MSIRTFVLGELYRGGMTYGAELVRRFERAGIPSWDAVAPSSVYRALLSLEEAGLVERFGKRARLRNRKLFRLTKAGRLAFEAAMALELGVPRTYRNPLNIAVAFAPILPRLMARDLLERRRLRLAEHEGFAAAVANAARGSDAVSAFERLAAERILLKARAELFFAGALGELLGAS